MKMTHNNSTQTTHYSQAVTSGSNFLILLCAPSHDSLTEYTSTLLENFPNLGAPTSLHKFVSPLTYEQLLSSLSIDPNTTEVALIFCGHGEPTSLQGPGTHPGAPDYNDVRSSFYDDSFIHLAPRFMLAFCCSAADELGISYERKTSGRTFVGFDAEIGFVKKDGPYAEWLRNILHGSAALMLGVTGADDPEEAIRDLYSNAISYFNSPEGKKKCRWWLAQSMYLQGQLDALKFIRSF
jgi:hypothetical protein